MSRRMRLERGLVRVADLAATFVFAAGGAVTGAAAGLDPVGVLVLAFLTGLGGGILRDLLLGAGRPAAMRETGYAVTVLLAAIAGWSLVGLVALSASPVVALDAAGLALAAVAGTQKAIAQKAPWLIAIFIGALSSVGGGVMRDLMLNEVPRVLRTDIYATAALLAAVIVVAGDRLRLDPRLVGVIAGLACFTLRVVAHQRGWALPIHGAGPVVPAPIAS